MCRRGRRWYGLLALSISSAQLMSCGYHSLHVALPGGGTRLAIEAIEASEVDDPWMARQVYTTVVDELARRGVGLAPVDDADAVMRIRLMRHETTSVAIRRGRLAAGRLELTLEAALGRGNGRVVWRSGLIRVWRTAGQPTGIVAAESSRRAADAALARDAAQRLVGALLAGSERPASP